MPSSEANVSPQQHAKCPNAARMRARLMLNGKMGDEGVGFGRGHQCSLKVDGEVSDE